MKQSLFLSALLLFPLLASADTVIMRNGDRFDGTFTGGTARQISIIDQNGVRRNFWSRDVQELMFGTPVVADRDNRFERNRQADNPGAEAGALDRVRNDIRSAMLNSNLNQSQRQVLESSRAVLGQAENNLNNGYRVDYRAVHVALDNVRNVMNQGGFRPEDRDAVLGDMRELRGMRNDYGRPYSEQDRSNDANWDR